MELTSAWMSVGDLDGVKTQTYGPNVAVTASGQRLAGDGSALARSAPAAVAVSAAAPKSAALTMRRAIRNMKAPHCSGVPRGNVRRSACASEGQTSN